MKNHFTVGNRAGDILGPGRCRDGIVTLAYSDLGPDTLTCSTPRESTPPIVVLLYNVAVTTPKDWLDPQ